MRPGIQESPEQSLRVLGRIRLSREAGETGTSIERQREDIEQWSALHRHTIVGWAIDSGVSGSVDPFDTPGLGPWLAPARLKEWDALVAYRLDRLSRRVIPLNRLFGFIQEHGKTLASVSESIDLSTWIGRLVANVIAGVAEGELEAIRERNLSSQAKLRQLGRWHGAGVPYGFSPEKRQDGWYLVHNEAEKRILREEILPRALAHESARSIASALNAAGFTTRKGGSWHVQSVLSILRNRALLGQHEHKGRLVVDQDGLPVQRGEPLVTTDEWARIQTSLSSRSIRTGERNQNQLSGVLTCHGIRHQPDCQRTESRSCGCPLCGAAVYAQRMPDREYSYYRCSDRSRRCASSAVRSDIVLELVEEHLLREIGDVPRRERVYVQGSDHTEALEAIQTALRTARKELDLGLYDGTEDEYFERLQRLTARRTELAALPTEPSGFQWRDVGETWGQAWQRMDVAERRALLLDSGIRAAVAGGLGKDLYCHLNIPSDVRGRIER
ncbi:recombinase family protein [Mycobacterium europaeum]|uniref:recombinase family protein n=1 Tax=Mycobacterium europaeum TaxID=761804 RepID=UPI002ADF69DD|nr:recombinase family protein [Mycobacterium europaeum]MEA1159777.1 recombinase family protein [Mycobacterium europaeum]